MEYVIMSFIKSKWMLSNQNYIITFVRWQLRLPDFIWNKMKLSEGRGKVKYMVSQQITDKIHILFLQHDM